ncbi:MAG: hypothetical protein KKC75_02695 [Nanoarchaeota archaeon]|nr:hypothetical protein [Nanoarchaeota archaeon]MBU1004211.1 hypothetical protein [Nanoarchaeota archaeon]MBU1946168.1 hypothetical protein [Nanoarchaeota archaeon]
MADPEEMKDLMEKYKQKLEKELGTAAQEKPQKTDTREYKKFKEEYTPGHLTLYEKLCSFSEKLVKVTPDKKKAEELQESINVCHLNLTPTGATSFAMLAPFFIIIVAGFISLVFLKSFFFVLFFIILGISIIGPLGRLPNFIATSWRMKASNQMVLCVFYVVTYMRHTSNLELALRFASDHISPPLSLDLKKVIWDVETEKYSTIKESLEAYLQTWRKFNMEFIEAFHLIEASLYEGDEKLRLETLDKSLDVILTETYEKMLHYAQNLHSPITMLHMLGVILPILGLVILPLVVSFMEGVKWYSISLLYNVGLPVLVYYLGKTILAKRPSGYGDTDISELPEYKKNTNVSVKFGGKELSISPLKICLMMGILLFLVGISPLVLHLFIQDETNLGFGEVDESSTCLRAYCLLDYRTDESGQSSGPFGLGASILGLFITIAFGFSIGYYYRLKSKNVIGIRKKTQQLEQEFASGLFQLGNRLGDGIPAETAFGRVSAGMEGTVSGSFFKMVSMNIRRLGMGVSQAIFDPKHGAMLFFPSDLIESSMKVLIESIKKGPKVAANALMNISRYIREIHKVNERLKDLMSEVISSMTSQIKFLTPVIAGIVIGITSMVTTILGKLTLQMKQLNAGEEGAGGALASGFFGQGVPTFYFQMIVGIYVVQITYILTVLSNGIENGSDKLNERSELAKNMTRATFLYCFVSLAIMLIFNMIANKIMAVSLVGT